MHCHSKFVQWKVRDLGSCFHFCHIPLDKEPEISISKPKPQPSKGSKVFDSKSGHKEGVKVAKNAKKMCNIEYGGGESVERSLSRKKTGRPLTEAKLPDEDYIVFCFREDGKIHLIDDENSSQQHPDNQVNTTATTTATKPAYEKEDEKGSKEIGAKWPPDEDRETKDAKNHVEQANASKLYPLEACAPTESESSSSSSFTFPELGTEWTGSPAHMPSAEKLEEPYDNIIHCYRFRTIGYP